MRIQRFRWTTLQLKSDLHHVSTDRTNIRYFSFIFIFIFIFILYLFQDLFLFTFILVFTFIILFSSYFQPVSPPFISFVLFFFNSLFLFYYFLFLFHSMILISLSHFSMFISIIISFLFYCIIADWPLVLGLEMPLKPEQKPTIHSLLSLHDEDIKYNVLKVLLTSGMSLIKHSPYVFTTFLLKNVYYVDNTHIFKKKLHFFFNYLQ